MPALRPGALIAVLAVASCSHPVIESAPRPSTRTSGTVVTGTSTAATLGIPPGHLPEPGTCRLWIPGVPPGQQKDPAEHGHGRGRRGTSAPSCEEIAASAPAGSWVVYRPTADRKLVHVRVIDDRRPGVITIIRIFEAETGRFVREERP